MFSFRLSIPTLFVRSSDYTSVTLFIQQVGFLNFITHVGSNYRTGIQTEIALPVQITCTEKQNIAS